MVRFLKVIRFALLLFFLVAVQGFAASVAATDPIKLTAEIETAWAQAYYSTTMLGSQKDEIYLKLLGQIENELKGLPQSAELWLWKGILTANRAEHNRLEGLSLAAEAKDYLEKSVSIDARAYYGSAYINLGILYTELPGGLVSFGSVEEAQKCFQRALEIDQRSIDVNFFYGKLLEKIGGQKNRAKAVELYKKALATSSRPEQTFADDSLKALVRQQLEELQN